MRSEAEGAIRQGEQRSGAKQTQPEVEEGNSLTHTDASESSADVSPSHEVSRWCAGSTWRRFSCPGVGQHPVKRPHQPFSCLLATLTAWSPTAARHNRRVLGGGLGGGGGDGRPSSAEPHSANEDFINEPQLRRTGN